jgi:twitching motility protein PilT
MRQKSMELNTLLNNSVKENASDLHLSPGAYPQIRVNGELRPVKDVGILEPETTKSLICGIMDKEQQLLFEKNLELDFLLNIPNVASFRINAFHQIHGIAAVFRVIPVEVPTLDKLGVPPIFKKLLSLPNGLIILAGSTGCGKSTTLAAMIDFINTNESSHIITIEDPVEFVHVNKKSLINQRQVHRDTTSFSSALRAALREDPDVILVGEMRDLETIRLALTAAETGHLVMATLHTNSAPYAINRIIDVFPSGEKNVVKNLISGSLQAVICQTLVPRINGGRAAAHEIMLGTTAIRNLIREEKIQQMYSIIQTGKAEGMCTMEQSLKELIAQNITTAEMAHKSSFEREFFENLK